MRDRIIILLYLSKAMRVHNKSTIIEVKRYEYFIEYNISYVYYYFIILIVIISISLYTTYFIFIFSPTDNYLF